MYEGLKHSIEDSLPAPPPASLKCLRTKQTKSALAACGVSMSDLDVAVVAAGAEVWLAHDPPLLPPAAASAPAGGESAAAATLLHDADYDRHIDFRWSRTDVRKGVLKASAVTTTAPPLAAQQPAVVVAPSPAAAAGAAGPAAAAAARRRLEPSLIEEAAAGEESCATPRLRFRPVGRSGWGAAQVAWLQRRLRARGFRCRLILEANRWFVHVLPIRASRALALRWIASRYGPPLSSMLVAICDDGDGDSIELTEGLPRVAVLLQPPAGACGTAVGAAGVWLAQGRLWDGKALGLPPAQPAEPAGLALPEDAEMEAAVRAAEAQRVFRATGPTTCSLDQPAAPSANSEASGAADWQAAAMAAAMAAFGFLAN